MTAEVELDRLLARIRALRPEGPSDPHLLVLVPSIEIQREVEHRLLEADLAAAGVFLSTPHFAIQRILLGHGPRRPLLRRPLLEQWLAREVEIQQGELRPTPIRNELAYLARHAAARRSLLVTLLGLRRIESAYGITFKGETERGRTFLSFLPPLAQAIENSGCEDRAAQLARACGALREGTAWPSPCQWIVYATRRREEPELVGLLRAAAQREIPIDFVIGPEAPPDGDSTRAESGEGVRPRASLSLRGTREPRFETYHAQGIEAEVAEACSRARDLIRAGMPPDRIALIAARSRPYDALVSKVATREDLPLVGTHGHSAIHEPRVRLAVQLLELVSQEVPRASFVATLRSLAAARDDDRLSLSAIGELDEATRHAGCSGGFDGIARILTTHLSSSKARSRTATGWKSIASLHTDLVSLREVLMRATNSDSQVRSIRQFLDSWLTIDARDLTRRAIDDSLASLGLRDAVGLRPMHLHEIASSFAAHLPSIAGNARSGGVAWLDVQATHGRDFDAVFLLGFERSAFPPPPGEHPHLARVDLQQLRARIAEARQGLPRAATAFFAPTPPLPGEDAEQAVEDLSRVLENCTQLVTVSYCRADELGKPRSPSPWIGAIAEAFGRPRQLSELFSDEQTHTSVPFEPSRRAEHRCAPNKSPSEEDVLVHAALRGGQRALEKAARAVTSAHERRLARACQWIAEVDSFEIRDGKSIRFDPVRLGTTRMIELGIGVSPFERLATCPLQFYFRDVLRARPLSPEPNYESTSALDVGNAAHAVLQHVYEKLFSEHLDLEPRIAAARELVRRELARLDDKFVAPIERHLDKLGSRTRASWRDALETFVEADLRALDRRGLDPSDFETELKQTIGVGLEQERIAVTLRGKIDRIDEPRDKSSDAHARIVDYKTGGAVRNSSPNTISVRDILGKNKLQLPLYALMLEERDGMLPDASLLGIAPRHRAEFGSALPEVRVDPTLWSSSRAELMGKLFDVARLLEEGSYPPKPSARYPCAYCDYQSACPRHHPPTCERLGITRD